MTVSFPLASKTYTLDPSTIARIYRWFGIGAAVEPGWQHEENIYPKIYPNIYNTYMLKQRHRTPLQCNCTLRVSWNWIPSGNELSPLQLAIIQTIKLHNREYPVQHIRNLEIYIRLSKKQIGCISEFSRTFPKYTHCVCVPGKSSRVPLHSGKLSVSRHWP
jgi:hypothetical protein